MAKSSSHKQAQGKAAGRGGKTEVKETIKDQMQLQNLARPQQKQKEAEI